MKFKKYILLILSVTVLVTACRVYDTISVDGNSVNDMSVYKTFAWLPDAVDTANSPYNNEVIRNNLRNYFGRSLAQRGFSVDLDSPDILLRVMIVNNPKVLHILHPPLPFRFYFSPYYYRSDYYSPYPQDYYYHNQHSVSCDPQGYCTEKINYMEGSVTLQVIDRLQNKIIWSCTAKGDIYDPAFIKRSIHPAVIAIMKEFPVKPIDNKKLNPVASPVSLK